MRTVKLTIAYDGTRFVGWQRQAEGDSVQGLLEAALSRFEGSHVTVHGAGRTDAGVHAVGQVASVQLASTHDLATLIRALNAQLPGDVRILGAEAVPDSFHARFSALSKTYRYLIRAGGTVSPFERAYVWHLPEYLDLQAMSVAAEMLIGTHDFSAFRSVAGHAENGTNVRTLSRSEMRPDGPPPGVCAAGGLIAYEVTGNGFLRHMVRAIVGTLAEIGRGWREAASIPELLTSGRRADAGATAPPQGLFLVRVDYD
jgi:tRNA pseudouridine38-40 synthase